MSDQFDIQDTLKRSRDFTKKLSSLFINREDHVKLMMVAAVAQEPLLLIGSPGTGKSALINRFVNLLNLTSNQFFEYTLTKFTEPSEILGPLDLDRMKKGEFHRKTQGKLPEAKLVFLDEVFKANSAILNTFLTIINERKFYQDGKAQKIPLKLLFAATNEIPIVNDLNALKDRFTLKVKINSVGGDKWDCLLQKGITQEIKNHYNQKELGDVYFTMEDLENLNDYLYKSMRKLSETGEDPYFESSLYLEFKRILKHIIHEYDVEISDRKFIKIYKLIRSKALLERGGGVEKEDFDILCHLGNNDEEIDALHENIIKILD